MGAKPVFAFVYELILRYLTTSYHCTGVSAGENWIKIPKLDQIKARIHREVAGTVKSITLSRTPTGKCYASIPDQGWRRCINTDTDARSRCGYRHGPNRPMYYL